MDVVKVVDGANTKSPTPADVRLSIVTAAIVIIGGHQWRASPHWLASARREAYACGNGKATPPFVEMQLEVGVFPRPVAKSGCVVGRFSYEGIGCETL